MVLITAFEITNLIIMSIVIGWIFSDFFKRFGIISYRYSDTYFKPILIATLVVSPGIIFHELMHKFVAMAFGAQATFYVSIYGLFLGIFLKLIGSPFIIFAPGYVSIIGNLKPWQDAIVAFAGPLGNLIVWFISMKMSKYDKPKRQIYWAFSAKINLFLFFFNLLPIPPLDGFQVLHGIIKTIMLHY